MLTGRRPGVGSERRCRACRQRRGKNSPSILAQFDRCRLLPSSAHSCSQKESRPKGNDEKMKKSSGKKWSSMYKKRDVLFLNNENYMVCGKSLTETNDVNIVNKGQERQRVHGVNVGQTTCDLAAAPAPHLLAGEGRASEILSPSRDKSSS